MNDSCGLSACCDRVRVHIEHDAVYCKVAISVSGKAAYLLVYVKLPENLSCIEEVLVLKYSTMVSTAPHKLLAQSSKLTSCHSMPVEAD